MLLVEGLLVVLRRVLQCFYDDLLQSFNPAIVSNLVVEVKELLPSLYLLPSLLSFFDEGLEHFLVRLIQFTVS